MGMCRLTSRAVAGAAAAVLSVALATGCGDSDSSSSAAGSGSGAGGGDAGKSLSIAYFASASANGFSHAVWEAMQAEAKRLGGKIELHQLDGNFNATTQFNQAQTAASSKQYDGAVVLANDTVGMAPAVKLLIKSGAVVSNVLNPMGPDLRSLEPQVDGLMSVIADPAYETRIQAQEVIKSCAKKDPCRVVIMIGGLQYPFDKIRYESYKNTLKSAPNVKVVALAQGNYDRNTGVTTMSNVLQAHPKFDVLLSAAEQDTAGAEIALKKAGWDVPALVKRGDLVINSLGGSKQGVAAVRAGRWNLTVGNFPATAGQLALRQVVQKLRGQDVAQPTINIDKVTPVPLVLTKAVLDQHPDFTGQWSG